MLWCGSMLPHHHMTYDDVVFLVTNKFKSGGLYEKHVVATWNVGNHLSICL